MFWFKTNEGINSRLTRDKVYLLDAGANYEDCTTDVTRTHHYGKPTDNEIVKYENLFLPLLPILRYFKLFNFAYTKVLQGSINLANVSFLLLQ